MRGRALAGVKGDATARIFCQQLAAELVSIAGNCQVAEDLRRTPAVGQGSATINKNQTLVSLTSPFG